MTTLPKGANTTLALDGEPVRRVLVGVSWQAPTTDRHPFDLDLAVVLADADSRAHNPGHLVFAQQLAPPATSAAQSDAHARESSPLDLSGRDASPLDISTPASPATAQNPTAQNPTAQTDDEEIEVDLALVPAHIDVVAFVLTLHDAASRGQTFSDLGSVAIRVRDLASGRELASFSPDLTDATETSMTLGEVYRRQSTDGSSQWKVRAVGQGSAQGLSGIAASYGIDR